MRPWAQVVTRVEKLLDTVEGNAQLKAMAGGDAVVSADVILAKNPEVNFSVILRRGRQHHAEARTAWRQPGSGARVKPVELTGR